MPRFATVCLFVLTTACIASSQEIQWIDNYPEAHEQAKLSGKPILLTFRCVP